MSYIETLLHEYPSLSLSVILFDLPLAAGLQLLEARASRLSPDHSIGYVERQIMAARRKVRAWYEAEFEIIPTALPPGRKTTPL